MNVLLIGSGGREHALALALAKSPLLDRLFVAPGNPGTAQIAQNVALDIGDFANVVAFCQAEAIGLVAIGPEQPLVDGLVDALEAAGIKAFGPSKAAARLEGSKGFTKDLCRANAIPTAAYERFTAAAPAKASISLASTWLAPAFAAAMATSPEPEAKSRTFLPAIRSGWSRT